MGKCSDVLDITYIDSCHSENGEQHGYSWSKTLSGEHLVTLGSRSRTCENLPCQNGVGCQLLVRWEWSHYCLGALGQSGNSHTQWSSLATTKGRAALPHPSLGQIPGHKAHCWHRSSLFQSCLFHFGSRRQRGQRHCG